MAECITCGRKALARSLCPTHYQIWRFENVPGAKQKHRAANNAYRREWRKSHPEAPRSKESNTQKNRQTVSDAPSYYVRKAMQLPVDAPSNLILLARDLLFLKRELKGNK